MPTTTWPKTEYQPRVPTAIGDAPQSVAPRQASVALDVRMRSRRNISQTFRRWVSRTIQKYGAAWRPKSCHQV